ncbi:hypothetical protein [Vibrio europaeus]|uniref:hypothetical protein n=1 Tax=Vibrio europaeus TaxID=300876 RepID=UPI00233E6A2C|nr:hypothetical protein [Vibrio europaeus]MDC5855954.1 hypothetical protein [Vibrio europaeus]
MDYVTFVVVVIFALIPIVYLGFNLWELYKSFPKVKAVWSRLARFEQHLFLMGLMLFLPIPMLKNSEFKDVYVFQLFIEAFPAMAGGMFVAGLIAYVRELHAYDSEQQAFKLDTPDTEQT